MKLTEGTRGDFNTEFSPPKDERIFGSSSVSWWVVRTPREKSFPPCTVGIEILNHLEQFPLLSLSLFTTTNTNKIRIKFRSCRETRNFFNAKTILVQIQMKDGTGTEINLAKG